MEDKYKNKLHYTDKVSIGLFALLNTISVLNLYKFDKDLMKGHLYLENDWFIFFIVARRLKDSLEKGDIYEITIDGTSFYLFLRIYYDSLALVVHYLFKKMYPNESRKWPVSSSFDKQLKWLEENNDPDFRKFKHAIQQYGYPELFRKMREIRNSLKETAQRQKSSRLNLEMRSGLPISKKLREEVTECLFKTISLTDFVGDYFFEHLKEVRTVPRWDYTYDGYPAAFMHDGEINIYKWYIDRV